MIKTRIFPIITLISISSLFFGCDWFDKINTPSSEFKPATSTPNEANVISKDNKIEDENTNTVFEEEKDAKDTEKNIDKIEDSTIPSIDNTNNKNSEIKGEKEEKIATSTPSAPIEKEENDFLASIGGDENWIAINLTGVEIPNNHKTFCLENIENLLIKKINFLREEHNLLPFSKNSTLINTSRFKSNVIIQTENNKDNNFTFNFISLAQKYGVENIRSATELSYGKELRISNLENDDKAEEIADILFKDLKKDAEADWLNEEYNSIGLGIIGQSKNETLNVDKNLEQSKIIKKNNILFISLNQQLFYIK